MFYEIIVGLGGLFGIESQDMELAIVGVASVKEGIGQ